MIRLVNIYSSDKDSLKRRVLKFLGYGKNDVQTALGVAPYGIDSNPIKDMIAVYAPTTDKGSAVIVGYINKNSLAQPGELRFFSTDSNGGEKFYTWLKNDGTFELNGNINNLVRYNQLNQELQTLISTLNAQLLAISTGIATGGGTYTPATLSLNINGAKTPNIKTE